MLGLKMTAIVGSAALVTLGLLGCSEESEPASGAQATGETESSQTETTSGESSGGDAAKAIEGFDGKTYSVLSTKTLDNGIVIEELHLGEGGECPKGATISIEYHGTLLDGTVFDSTRERPEPGGPWPLPSLIQGWRWGVPGMKVGGVRRLTIPSDLGYGEGGSPPVIGPNADLVFVIEMVSFQQ